MPSSTSTASAISLTTPLAPSDLLFESMRFSSGISSLEQMQLSLLSEKSEIEPEQLLGQPVDLHIELREGEARHICGYVTRFGLGRHQGRYFGYIAEVNPWLWFLTRTSDCRIFQDMTVPDIVEKVFADHSDIANYELKLGRSYRKRDYCVQYRETDFNFIARLMEDEGIYWYFEHAQGEHKLLLVDSSGEHTPAPGYEKLPYYANVGQISPDVDFVTNWNFSREVRTGKVTLRSYNFETPSTSLEVTQQLERSHSLAKDEQFDYQGDYLKKGDGQHLADMRVDEQQTRHEQITGQTNAHGLATGRLFTLTRHPRADQNAEYLCVQTQISARSGELEADRDDGDYQCHFAAIPSGQQFRAQRRTPKPFVQGPQTAVVTGPGGEEIFTDKYGRVKVQFHWDRLGKKNESSSCWMRVASVWAGKSFGFIQVPRIGQEVIVDFLEGDPDQPIITGRVYNAEMMPPWELPANATQSGVLSRSSKGGAYGNANALRFEDRKGEEQLWLHAEKDQLTEVEHDEDKWVGNDRRKTIDGNETNVVHKNRTETVDLDETITIHQNRSERVDLDESISIGVNRSEDVGANETITIGANRSVTIGGNKTETVAIAKAETIGAAKALTIGLGYQTSVGAMMNTTVGGFQTSQIGLFKNTVVGKDYSISSGAVYSVDAKDEIHLTVGKASLTMKSDGTIILNGHTLSVGTTGEQTFKADGDVTVKGKKILEN